MDQDLERLNELKQKIDFLNEQCGAEAGKICQEKGFDYDKRKWRLKLDKLLDKYADLLYPIVEEHDQLAAKLNEEAEKAQKAKFK